MCKTVFSSANLYTWIRILCNLSLCLWFVSQWVDFSFVRHGRIVSYEDCLVFIKTLNELSDKKYRLPTIAEWLLAAKPDSGNKISKLGWFRESGHSLHDVGLKAPNSYGLYDMLGNVHEWCQERFNINNSETQVSSSINGHFAAECGGHFDAHVNSFSYFSGAEIDAVGNCNSVTGFRIARDIN